MCVLVYIHILCFVLVCVGSDAVHIILCVNIVSAFMSDALSSISNLTCYSTGNVDKKQVILICRNLLHTYIKYPVHVYNENN